MAPIELAEDRRVTEEHVFPVSFIEISRRVQRWISADMGPHWRVFGVGGITGLRLFDTWRILRLP